MKKLKLLSLVLAIMMVMSVLVVTPLASSAADPANYTSDDAAVAADFVFRVTERTGTEEISYYKTYEDAIAAVADNGTIYILADYTMVGKRANIDSGKSVNFVGVPKAGVNPVMRTSQDDRFSNLGKSGTKTTFTFTNVTFEHMGVSLIFQAQADSTLILNEGAKFTYKAGVVNTTPMFIMQARSTLIVNEGAVLEQANAPAIDGAIVGANRNAALVKTNEANVTLNINGGTFSTAGVQIWGYEVAQMNLNADVLDPAKTAKYYDGTNVKTFDIVAKDATLAAKWGLVVDSAPIADFAVDYYTSSFTAFKATKDTIELTADVTLTKPLVITNTVTIDGKGKTITAGAFTAIRAESGAKVTLTDVTVVSNSAHAGNKEGTITVNGGEVILGNKATVKTVHLTAGAAATDNTSYVTFRAFNGGKVTVNTGASVIGCGCIFSSDGYSNTTFTINGGSLETPFRFYVTNTGSNNVINLNGGTIKTTYTGSGNSVFYFWSATSSKIYVNGTVITKPSDLKIADSGAAAGVVIHELSDEELGDSDSVTFWKAQYSLWGKTWPDYSNPVASIGTKLFFTFKKALEAAANGDTIKLLADVEIDSKVALTATSATKITIDGDNKKLTTIASDAFVEIGANVTLELKNVNVVATANTAQGMIHISGGTLNLLSGAKIETAVDANPVSGNSAFVAIKAIADGATFAMEEGAEIKSWGLALKAEGFNHDFTINGGKVETNWRIYDQNGDKTALLTINGGEIKSTYPSNSGDFRSMFPCYQITNGAININGGKIISGGMNVFQGSVKVTMNGGEIIVPQDVKINGGNSCSFTLSSGKLTEGDVVTDFTNGAYISGYNVILGEEITLNLFVASAGYTGGKFEYVHPTLGTTEIYASETSDKVSGLMVYKYSAVIAPDDFASEITFNLYKPGETTVAKTATISVKGYLEALIADDTQAPETVALAKALLNYGAAAQTYTGKNTGALVNASLEAADKNLADIPTEVIAAYDKLRLNGEIQGITVDSAAVVLKDGALVIEYKVTLADGAKVADFTLKGGEFGDKVIVSEGLFFQDIDAWDEISVKANGNTLKAWFAPYITAGAADTSAELKTFLKAVYNVQVAVEGYIEFLETPAEPAENPAA